MASAQQRSSSPGPSGAKQPRHSAKPATPPDFTTITLRFDIGPPSAGPQASRIQAKPRRSARHRVQEFLVAVLVIVAPPAAVDHHLLLLVLRVGRVEALQLGR